MKAHEIEIKEANKTISTLKKLLEKQKRQNREIKIKFEQEITEKLQE